MSDFETRTCAACGTEFKVHPSSNAAENEYCSPACQSDG